MKQYKVLTIVGARPQFIKAAMLSRIFSQQHDIQEILVHTGQHYDDNMSAIFFDQLKIPKPSYFLAVGSASQAQQTAAMLEKLDAIYEKEKPDATIVYGDTNSTLAGALCSVKHGVPVIHIEAGMRSYDKNQPEEINRVTTDHVSELLLCSSEHAARALEREGITKNVKVTGDILQDATLAFSSLPSTILDTLSLQSKQYILATIHRPETTNTKAHLNSVVRAFLASTSIVVFAVHPRTKKYLLDYGLLAQLEAATHIKLIEPLGYVDMLHLQKHAAKIVTDSGGIQKEAYWLGIPCITTREYTEWKELVDAGWNTVVGYDEASIIEAMQTFTPPREHPSLFGDGKAANHIYNESLSFLKQRHASRR